MFSFIIFLIALWSFVVAANALPKRELYNKFDTIVAFGDSYTDYGSLDIFYQKMFNRHSLQAPNALVSATMKPLSIQYPYQMLSQKDGVMDNFGLNTCKI
jgi:hypothetical protein